MVLVKALLNASVTGLIDFSAKNIFLKLNGLRFFLKKITVFFHSYYFLVIFDYERFIDVGIYTQRVFKLKKTYRIITLKPIDYAQQKN